MIPIVLREKNWRLDHASIHSVGSFGNDPFKHDIDRSVFAGHRVPTCRRCGAQPFGFAAAFALAPAQVTQMSERLGRLARQGLSLWEAVVSRALAMALTAPKRTPSE
jgi:hypothetical protein